MKINICMASDDKYWYYMATTIVSILKNANKSDELHFYILCNQVNEKYKKYLKTLKQIKDFDVTCFDIDIKDYEQFPSGGEHITNTTYFRYKIAELCPDIDKIIYLDCDVIVMQSLSELFENDLTGYYLGGVEDVGYYYWRHYNPKLIYKEGFYINAGMLLINLEEWRKNDLFHKFVDFTIKEAEKISIGDQDVINQVCKGKIKQLDYKWNVQDSFYRDKPEREYNPNCQQIIDAAENPAIIHYTYVRKPWSDFDMPKAYEWIKYDVIRRRGCAQIWYCLKIFLYYVCSLTIKPQKYIIRIFCIKLTIKR